MYIHKSFSVTLLLFSLIATSACGQPRKDVSVSEAKALIEKGKVVVLDVRTPSEWNSGHLKDAVHANVNDANFEATVASLSKKKPVIVYCAVGGRSARASDILTKKGWKTVYNMVGGYNAWVSAGLPVITDR